MSNHKYGLLTYRWQSFIMALKVCHIYFMTNEGIETANLYALSVINKIALNQFKMD